MVAIVVILSIIALVLFSIILKNGREDDKKRKISRICVIVGTSAVIEEEKAIFADFMLGVFADTLSSDATNGDEYHKKSLPEKRGQRLKELFFMLVNNSENDEVRERTKEMLKKQFNVSEGMLSRVCMHSKGVE